MIVACPTCRREIPAGDVHLETGLARCTKCDRVFTVSAGPVAVAVGRPPSVTEEEIAGRFTLTWRWFTPVALFLILFCVVWDGFLVMWHGVLLGSILTGNVGPEALCPSLFALPHTVVGIVLPYIAAAQLVNRTTVQLGEGAVTIRHGPLWWPGVRRLESRDIGSLRMDVTYNRNSASYRLMARRRDGTEVSLLSAEREVVQYVGQSVGHRLGVPFAAH